VHRDFVLETGRRGAGVESPELPRDLSVPIALVEPLAAWEDELFARCLVDHFDLLAVPRRADPFVVVTDGDPIHSLHVLRLEAEGVAFAALEKIAPALELARPDLPARPVQGDGHVRVGACAAKI